MTNLRAQQAIGQTLRTAGLALALLLLGLRIAGAVEPLQLELIDDAPASGAAYTLADVARYVSGDQQLWEQLAAEKLGYAPAPGQTITVSRETLLGRLAERGYDWRALQVTGPEVLTIHGAEQSAAAEDVLALLERDAAEVLGTAVRFETTRALPQPPLPAGTLEVSVRYPQKAGFWLPDAVEYRVDGLLVAAVPLAQYGAFHLPVVIAPEGIPGRTLIDGTYLGVEEREVRPGQEVVPMAGAALGMTTRAPVAAGALLRLSRLQAAYDVARGASVTLVISGGSVELRARAVAMNNAYIGQRLLVERADDRARFMGRVVAGPMVVVE